jgi:hypothetical protein
MAPYDRAAEVAVPQIAMDNGHACEVCAVRWSGNRDGAEYASIRTTPGGAGHDLNGRNLLWWKLVG